MWKVFRGEAESTNLQPVESGEAVEAFGAICVDEATAGRLGLTKLSTVRGDLGQGKLYALDELAVLNQEGKCSVDRIARTFTLPARAPAQKPAK
jgi:hypothetical protein